MEPSRQAIQAALNRDWKEAIRLNTAILKDNPKDVDALNRLGRAYFENGLKTKSLSTYEKVLHIDKYNHIAAKSIELLKTSRVTHNPAGQPSVGSALPIFLEEPGVTKTVALIRPGDSKVVSRLRPGDPVVLSAREHCVSVNSLQNEYLGRLPDDLASRLRTFITDGNKYSAWIRSVDMPILKIFIKEISRTSKYRNSPSFPLTEKLSYAAFTPPELVHDIKVNTSATGEDADDNFAREDFDDDSEPELIPMPDND